MKEPIHALSSIGSALFARNAHAEEADATGTYLIECFDADGNLRWSDAIENLVTTAGKNAALDVFLGGSAFTAWALGLVDGGSTPTFNVADIMSSHAGWTESTAYSNATRPAPTFNAAASGSKATTATAFNINGTATIAGVFLVNQTTKGGTTGTLYSCGAFSGGNRSVISGDTLNVTYTASL